MAAPAYQYDEDKLRYVVAVARNVPVLYIRIRIQEHGN
jgi:hypothetical protein